MQIEKSRAELGKMAAIFTVDVDAVPLYTKYFDITHVPATVFYFNTQHMKIESG